MFALWKRVPNILLALSALNASGRASRTYPRTRARSETLAFWSITWPKDLLFGSSPRPPSPPNLNVLLQVQGAREVKTPKRPRDHGDCGPSDNILGCDLLGDASIKA